MTTIDAISAAPSYALTPTAGSTSATGASATAPSALSVDYMSLLLAQMRNQDPTSPMNPSEMVTQITQIGMLQQLTQLATDEATVLSTQTRSAAASFLGNTVSYQDANGGTAAGVVTAVSFSGPAPTVTVNGSPVALSSILGLTAGTAAPTQS